MRFEALDAAIKSPALKAVVRHWTKARASRPMPGWGDLRPSCIARQLPIIWAYTYDRARDAFIGRLAGDRIEAIFGKSFRNTPLTEIFPKSEFKNVFERAKRVVCEPAACRSEGLVLKQLNMYGYGERIILPLADDGIHGDGLLGCTDYKSSLTPLEDQHPQSDGWFPL